MARRSILTPARQEQERAPEAPPASGPVGAVAPSTRPSRKAKMHLGGYFDADDPTVIAFQKLRIDLRRSQQDMLMEAVSDFVAKHAAARAFQ
jgi:hypothetical protein